MPLTTHRRASHLGNTRARARTHGACRARGSWPRVGHHVKGIHWELSEYLCVAALKDVDLHVKLSGTEGLKRLQAAQRRLLTYASSRPG